MIEIMTVGKAKITVEVDGVTTTWVVSNLCVHEGQSETLPGTCTVELVGSVVPETPESEERHEKHLLS